MKRKNSTNDDDRVQRSSYSNDIDNNVSTKKNKTNKHKDKDMRLCLHCLADVDYNANGTYHSKNCRKYNVARQDVFKLVKGDDMIACNCNNKPVKYCNYIKQPYCCEIPALLTLIRSTKFKDRKNTLCYTDFFEIVQQVRRQYHSKVTLVPKKIDSNVDRSTTASSIGSKETPMNGPYDSNERKTASLNDSMSNADDLSMALEAMNITNNSFKKINSSDTCSNDDSNDISDESDASIPLFINNDDNNDISEECNDITSILIKVIEIGGVVILYLEPKEIINIFSITKEFKSLKLIPQVILSRAMTCGLKEKFDNHSIPSFEITNLPAYPCNKKDLKKVHSLIKSLKCCFSLRMMLGSFSKVSSVSMSKGCDESSYIFKITKGSARRVSVKVTGEFCNIEDEESFFHHNGEFFSIMPATCNFCDRTSCRLCGEYNDCSECGSAICGSCEDSYFECSICENCYCENCDSEFVTCDGCCEIICSKCIDYEDAATVCYSCDSQYCSSCEDFNICEQCDEQFCSDCAGDDRCTCYECGSFYCVDCKDDIKSCDECQKCLCVDCYENSQSVTCSGCDSFYCDECADCSTRACSHCNNFYCLASAETWKKCKKCNFAQVCDDCRGDYFARCKTCNKLSLCLDCSSKTDSCCKGKRKHKKKWNKKHKLAAGTNPLLIDNPVSENNESTTRNDESLKSLTKE